MYCKKVNFVQSSHNDKNILGEAETERGPLESVKMYEICEPQMKRKRVVLE